MNYLIGFGLLVWASIVISSFALASAVSYNLSLSNGTISGTRTVDGKVEAFSFSAEEERGLILVSRRLIAKSLGDTTRSDSHPFSFANPEQTEINVTAPANYFVFSSFFNDDEVYQPKRVSQFIVAFAKKDMWTKTQFRFRGTNFELINPKAGSHIEPKHWENCIKSIWPTFTEKFGSPTDHLVFVDLEGPISGGPLGENVLGIFATEKTTPNFQEDMQANLGWTPQPTTRAYVEANYPKAANQWEEYLFGTIAHEIGHLFFGFGLTREEVKNADELWFSLGLGMLYDMDVTQKLIGRKPQLELDIIKRWLTKFANLPDVDQRLINPNKTNDKKYPFDRKKVFAHGKAAFYLEKVREKVGLESFDTAVKKYVTKCRDCVRGYEDFKQFLPAGGRELADLEQQLKVTALSKETARESANTPHIINLGEQLDGYRTKSLKLSMKDKVQLFEKMVVAPQSEAFAKLIFKGQPASKSLHDYLPKAEPSFEAAVALAKEFQPIIDVTLAEYKRSFPNADYRYTLLLLPSFTFDGRADELPDGTILVAFGLDRLSRYKRDDIQIVVAHEMFHALQMQSIKSKTRKSLSLTDVWHEVWFEGLATYASGVITGRKSVSDVLGNKNVDGCKNDLPNEKTSLLANFDRKTADVPDLMDRWFNGHQFAYCLGYLAIADIAKNQSLTDLLEWELIPDTRAKLYERISSLSIVE